MLEERVIYILCLRLFKKVRYCEENFGYFGFLIEYYCYFIFLIRRYFDFVIYRIMKDVLKGKMIEKKIQRFKFKMLEIVKWILQRERVVEEVECEMIDFKKVEFMQDKIGQVFEGIIFNVMFFGFFVEFENIIEGLVRVSFLEDDYYVFNEKIYQLIGERLKKVYKIGDRVKVMLIDVNVLFR